MSQMKYFRSAKILHLRAISSAVEHCLHTAGASGSTPLSPNVFFYWISNMHASIWQTIAETSFWVYILYAMIVFIGYQHSKERAIPTLVLWTSMIAFISASIIGMSFFVKL